MHDRVRAFIEAASKGREPEETFDALALAIALFQAERIPGYRRLCHARGSDPARATRSAEIVAVPTDAFRFTRIAAHPPEEDRAVFRTSGTTADARGVHALATTATYEAAALAWGEIMLFPDRPSRLRALLLVPSREELPDSSLGFMLSLFADRFGSGSDRAFLDGRIDEARLRGIAEGSRERAEPVAVLGTSFAFVHALDALGGALLPLAEGSRVMHTGGFKGRSREVRPEELRYAIARTFGLGEAFVVGEYGMTELSSQLYEGTLRGALGLPVASSRHGVFLPPPWVRIVPVDDETLEPVDEGRTGILRIEDLANVDSAVVIQTADRGRLAHGGVELLGRLPGAPPRGCSILADELLGRQAGE